MNSVRTYSTNLYRESLKRAQVLSKTKSVLAVPMTEKPKAEEEQEVIWPRRVFSGIQPTGALHLGNYLGAVKKWSTLQDGKENVTFCIVDMHSITLPQDPIILRESILELAAGMLGCGIDPAKANVFVQSAVKEHAELCWILSSITTMARLSHLPQYKEKTLQLKDIPLGLFVYPVLQAADIMLYKSTHVPVGEDQTQHIQIAQHLAKIFNGKFGNTFPICHAVIEKNCGSRIRSLRYPNKKMSKSEADKRSTIYLTDEPEVIVDKIKKAVTDFTSDVTYDPTSRVGVSNLITIHSLLTSQSVEKICEEAKTIDTGTYKLRVADAIVEHLKPIRCKIKEHLTKKRELVYFLEMGAEKARQIAQQTMAEVRDKIGLGTANYRSAALMEVKQMPLLPEREAQNLLRLPEPKKAAAPAPTDEKAEELNPPKEKPTESDKLSEEIKI